MPSEARRLRPALVSFRCASPPARGAPTGCRGLTKERGGVLRLLDNARTGREFLANLWSAQKKTRQFPGGSSHVPQVRRAAQPSWAGLMPTGNDLSQTKCASPLKMASWGSGTRPRGRPGLKEVADCTFDRAEGEGAEAREKARRSWSHSGPIRVRGSQRAASDRPFRRFNTRG